MFVGPQQTTVMKNLRKRLTAVDSIVAVTGPVGVGKTTVVTRALESISPGRMVAWVGRMSLAPDEVLELLLTGFGIARQAKGTIQKFAAFRRLLGERAAAGAQVAIVVEDARRIGSDALVELEALTAADSGDAIGANIILMGQPELNEWLASPAMARLQQRTRLRQKVEPFNAPEVQGYLRHSVRAAGGDFDSIFDGGAVDMLYRCSEGIPRVINNLCESALTMAAEEGARPLTAEFIQKVANDALGIQVELPTVIEELGVATQPDLERAKTPDKDFDVDEAVVAAPVEPAPLPEPEPEPERKPERKPKPEIPELIQDTLPSIKALDSTPEPEVSAESDVAATQTQKKPDWAVERPGANDDADEEIPEELTFEVEPTSRMRVVNADDIVLKDKKKKNTEVEAAPKFKMAPMISVDRNTKVNIQPESTAIPEPPAVKAEPDSNDDDLPTLSDSMRIDAPTPAPLEALAEDKPEPEPEPQPEAAPDPEPDPQPEPASVAAKKPKSGLADSPRMPDIDALEAAIEAAHKGEPGDQPAPPAAADKVPAGNDGTVVGIPALTLDQSIEDKHSKDVVPDELAQELGNAESLDDLSDKMAETLFGDEDFDAIAADVVANPPTSAVAPGAPGDDVSPVMLETGNEAVSTDASKPDLSEVSDSGHKELGYTGEFNMSVTNRLKMLGKLNKDSANCEKIEMGDDKPAEKAPKPKAPQPEPIEQQIKASMTETLQALSSTNAPLRPVEKDEPEDKKSAGLFSRFKRS